MLLDLRQDAGAVVTVHFLNILKTRHRGERDSFLFLSSTFRV